MNLFFSHLAGQEKFKKNIEGLWRERRIPHTMIFYGEEGLGKTTAALDLAANLTNSLPMDEDFSQTGFSEDLWKDVAKWDKASEKTLLLTGAKESVWYLRPIGTGLRIDQFRAFLKEMAAFDDTPKVCIIDEAQTMKDEVANSLLKTLEEPPAQVYFILITHDIHALLPTILSRGEKFGFFPLSFDVYRNLLMSDMEKYALPSGMSMEMAYDLSVGNPGVTMDLCKDDEPEPDRAMRFWETVTWSSMPFSTLFSWKLGERKDFLRLLRWILLVGRDIMVMSDVGDISFARCNQVEERLRKVAPYWGEGRAQKALDVLQTAELACRRNISVKNIWDMVAIRLSHIKRGI